MARKFHVRSSLGLAVAICMLVSAVAAILITGRAAQPALTAASKAALRYASGYPQLVSVEPLPVLEGEMCQWMPASSSTLLAPAPQRDARAGSADADRAPVRVIRDTFPTYSAIAVNLQSDEVFLQDENLFGIKVFNRLDNTPPSAAFTEPKRSIAGGPVTKQEFNCGIYVDPVTGDIYSITNDTLDTMTVFPWNASGEIKPKRELSTPHGTFGISVDEQAQEIYLTVQHDNSVVVYPKHAQGEDRPRRTLDGDKTQLEDPHGVAADAKNDLLFVSNHGHANFESPDSGKFEPASVTVYPLKADGNTAPIRIIEGPRTRLNWPAAMWVDSERGELYVANDGDDSVLVFKTTDHGDVVPTRMIRGPKTHVSNPTGVFLDTKNEELWVSSMGNHSAVAFRRTANGDVAPLRIIRSAPLEKKALAIGNPGGVAYDSKRDEVLVPN
jgi:DNA-binding beta-propeller fold protein YncE